MRDDQLIFLISLPRSGSTMLQKILGSHTDIYTRSEPWLMLHPLHMLKSEGIEASYDAQLAKDGVRDFLHDLPDNGEEFYYQKLRECYLSLYKPYLDTRGKKRFLDKTPRYYLIFDELQKTFPNAKFIILYRNPLAVLASILDKWIKGRYELLSNYRCDLEQGVEFLQRDFSSYANTHLIRYEELVAIPERQIKSIFNFLQLENQPDCIFYGKNQTEEWKFGDKITIAEKSKPDPAFAMQWLHQLDNPVLCKLLNDYLLQLGEDVFNRLGYSYDEAEKALAKHLNIPSQATSDAFSFQSYLYSNTGQLTIANERNVSLKRKLGKLTNSLDVFKIKLDKKDERIETLHQKITEMQSEFSEVMNMENKEKMRLKNMLAKKDERIETLHQKFTEVQSEFSESMRREQEEKYKMNKILTERGRAIDSISHDLLRMLEAVDELKNYRIMLNPNKKIRAYEKLIEIKNMINYPYKTH